jgi:hypothetical protein
LVLVYLFFPEGEIVMTIPVEFRKVKCLWSFGVGYPLQVLDVYLIFESERSCLGNTDGYDDWAHTLMHIPGEYNGEKYEYLDVEHIDVYPSINAPEGKTFTMEIETNAGLHFEFTSIRKIRIDSDDTLLLYPKGKITCYSFPKEVVEKFWFYLSQDNSP